MPKLHRYFLPLLLSFSLLVCSVYLFLLIAVNPKTIQDSLVKTVEGMTQGEFSFQDFRISFFPRISAEAKEARLSLKDSPVPAIRAAKVKFYWTILSFLFRRSDLSRIEVSGAETNFQVPQGFLENIKLKNIRLRLGPIRSGIPLRVEVSGDLDEVSESISGSLTLSPFKEGQALAWASLGLEGEIKLAHIPLSRLKLGQLEFFKNTVIRQGEAQAEGEFFKPPGTAVIEARGQVGCRELSYELLKDTGNEVSPAFDGNFEFEASWDWLSDALLIKRSVFQNSFIGTLSLSGGWLSRTNELRNVHLKGTEISLDSLTQYYLGIRDAIPVNIGFSGRSTLEMSLEGTLDHLSLHAHWDLGPTLLAYTPYFTKPKDVPLNVAFDFVVKDRTVLAGDFSAKIQEAALKGTLTDFDIHSGMGQLNMITNKFPLEGWEALLPPFENYTLQGEAKILANLTGDFIHRPQEVQRMLHFTMENGDIVSKKGGLGLHQIFFTLDYGAIAIETKEARFEVGDSPISLTAVLYDPLGDSSLKVKVDSPLFRPYAFWAVLKEWGAAGLLSPEVKQYSEDALNSLKRVLPPDEALENFSTEWVFAAPGLTLSNLQFDVYSGQGKMKGRFDLEGSQPVYSFEGELNRINLAQFFSREKKENKILEGNFFTAFKIEGKNLDPAAGTKGLAGKGQFSITDGEFHTFNLLDAISQIKGFSSLKPFVSAGTRFDDLRSPFVISEEKMKTEGLRITASDYSVQADGEITDQGVVNYRLDVYLPLPLVGEIIKTAGVSAKSEGEKHFGPIPFLLAGRLENPDLKPDPVLLPQLQDNLAKKKTQRVLKNFLSEEFFFKSSANP